MTYHPSAFFTGRSPSGRRSGWRAPIATAGRWLVGPLGAALLAFSLAAPAKAERVVTDMAGRQVRIADDIRRVYAVGHVVPVIDAVAPDKLIDSLRLPDAARRFLPAAYFEGKAIPSGGQRFSDEEILRMAPDLIIMETGRTAQEQAERLMEKLHLPVVLVDQDMYRYKQSFSFLGDLLGRPAQARSLIDFVASHLDPIALKVRTIPATQRRRVYYAEGSDGLSTNPSGSAHTQVLDFVGGINVLQGNDTASEGTNAVSIEQLYLWQPDTILVWTPGADQLTTWRAIADNPQWKNLAAVKQGRLIQIPWLPFSWFDRPPGSNRILGAIWLAQTLYPEFFRFDLNAVTRDYFRRFYHVELTAADAAYLLHLAHPDQTTAVASQHH